MDGKNGNKMKLEKNGSIFSTLNALCLPNSALEICWMTFLNSTGTREMTKGTKVKTSA